MTSPAPETIEREKGKLFLSDAKIICVWRDLSGSPDLVQTFSKQTT